LCTFGTRSNGILQSSSAPGLPLRGIPKASLVWNYEQNITCMHGKCKFFVSEAMVFVELTMRARERPALFCIFMQDLPPFAQLDRRAAGQ
ncbi:MAG: hypothetical protein IJ649_00035, partial [Oscillospiraceae bacterium]|nr:hypothetical protein [Oscillospiraceae bacterium]